MSTFTWAPSPGGKQSIQPKVLKAQFGDGYEQRVGDGINTMARVWSLSFTRPVAEIDAIENFLRTAAGSTAFDWAPPRGPAGKFVCDAWDREDTYRPVNVLTATFREVFEP